MAKKKVKKILFIIIPLIIAFLLGAVLIYYFGAFYPYYDSIKRVEFAIPGLNEKFVPQGFCYDDLTDTYFLSGYMADDSASRIYSVDNNGNSKFVTMTYNDKVNAGHMGGIAVHNNTIWVATSGKVYRLDKNAVLTAQNGQTVTAIDRFDSNTNSSFITAFNGYLWVGEFYRQGNYETDESHYYKIDETSTNKAMAFCFTINEVNSFGIESTTPIKGISLPNQVQGIDFTNDGKIICSTSYSVPSAHILIYSLDAQSQKTVQLFDTDFSINVLSSANLVKDIEAPAMSEEIVYKEGRLYILYESACVKYAIGNRRRLKNVESILIEN